MLRIGYSDAFHVPIHLYLDTYICVQKYIIALLKLLIYIDTYTETRLYIAVSVNTKIIR